MKDRDKRDVPRIIVDPENVDWRLLHQDPPGYERPDPDPQRRPDMANLIATYSQPQYVDRGRRAFGGYLLALLAGTAVAVAERTGLINLIPEEIDNKPASPEETDGQRDQTERGPVIEGYTLTEEDIRIDEALYLGQEGTLRDETIKAYDYVTSRVRAKANAPFSAIYRNDPNCGLGGITFADRRICQTNTCNGIEIINAVAIQAHEFVHQIMFDKYRRPAGSVILNEGYATYGAGDYWGADHAEKVRYYKSQGLFFPLDTPLPAFAPQNMNTYNALYYQWSTFCGFLLERYGQEKFDQVYVMDDKLGAAQFQTVYGKTIEELEIEWKGAFGF